MRHVQMINLKSMCQRSIFRVWHERLGHVGQHSLKDLIKKNLVEGVKVDKCENSFCEPCVLGKAHKLPFNKKIVRKTVPGEYIHSDVGGPIETPSLSGARFYVLFKDDASAYRRLYVLKHKSEVYDKAVEFIREVNNKFKRSPRVLFSDRGR